MNSISFFFLKRNNLLKKHLTPLCDCCRGSLHGGRIEIDLRGRISAARLVERHGRTSHLYHIRHCFHPHLAAKLGHYIFLHC